MDLVKTKTKLWRHIYYDIEVPRPKSHDIEIPRPKSHDIEFLWNSDPYAPIWCCPKKLAAEIPTAAWKHRPNWPLWLIMKKRGWKLYHSPNPRGVQKCNSAGRSTHLCWEPSYTRTHISLPGIKNVNKPKTRAARTVYGLIFLPFNKIVVSFFSFLSQDANKTRSNCAIRLQSVKETQTR